MTENDRDELVRHYAAGETTWRTLQERGFEDYVEVLGRLGELGLRAPMAQSDGPNAAARARGRAMIRKALGART